MLLWFSLKYKLIDLGSLGSSCCKSIWALIFWNSRKVWSSKSSIFQKMMISMLIRTCTSWELLEVWIFNSLELKFLLPPKISKWMAKIYIYREISWALGRLGPICLEWSGSDQLFWQARAHYFFGPFFIFRA